MENISSGYTKNYKPDQRNKIQTGNYPHQGRETKEVHVSKASKQIVKAPENRPSRLPEKISKHFVNEEKNRKNKIERSKSLIREKLVEH
jgi:hypothetical protein